MVTVRIWSLAQGRAVLAAAAAQALTIRLATGDGSLRFCGVGYWRQVEQALQDPSVLTGPIPTLEPGLRPRHLATVASLGDVPPLTVPLLADADDLPGLVMAGLRSGLRQLVFNGREDVRERLDDMAMQLGGRVADALPGPVVALAPEDGSAAIAGYLHAFRPPW